MGGLTMQFDFTTLNTGGGVHPFAASHGVTDPNIISFSVAEMRFNLAPGVTEAMHKIVDRGCFGYAPPDKERYDAALTDWMLRRHKWKISPDWAIQSSGVLVAMPTAMPSEPLIRKFGILTGRTDGSFSFSSKLGIKSTTSLSRSARKASWVTS